MTSKIRECVQDIIDIANSDSQNDEERMKQRIERFFADLQTFKAEWPDQDIQQYISRLDEVMTAASTQLDTSPAASDLLEQAIDYVEKRRTR